MTDNSTTSKPVILTDNAKRQIAKIVAKEPIGTILRISVNGGGCSGFSYEYNLVQEKAKDDDLVLGDAKATVFIDALSLEFMTGAEIDFIDELAGQSFKINNPNAVASCGCGSSFAV